MILNIVIILWQVRCLRSDTKKHHSYFYCSTSQEICGQSPKKVAKSRLGGEDETQHEL